MAWGGTHQAAKNHAILQKTNMGNLPQTLANINKPLVKDTIHETAVVWLQMLEVNKMHKAWD
jgi:hypothetical protein